MRVDAKVLDRNLMLSLYREVTANYGRPTQQAPVNVCIQLPRIHTVSVNVYSVSQKKIPPKGSWHFSFFSQTVENF